MIMIRGTANRGSNRTERIRRETTNVRIDRDARFTRNNRIIVFCRVAQTRRMRVGRERSLGSDGFRDRVAGKITKFVPTTSSSQYT